MRRSGGFALVGLILAMPTSAHAGTVERLFNEYEDYDAVWYRAEPGERNRVTVEVAAKTVTIMDSGAPVTVQPHSGCTVIGKGRARCRRRPHVLIDVGDREDTVRFSYRAPVSGDFARVEGGAGADTLRGGPKSEILDGGPGADKVFGGAGNDNLTGGEGADVVRGGPGRDVVNVHDYNGRPSDNISCGRGRDALNYDLDPADVVHRDCERIASVGGGLPLTPTFKSTSAGSYVAPCRSIGNGRRTRCTAHVVLTDRLGRLLAEGRASMRAAPYHGIRIHTGHLRVTVWLTSLGRRMLLSGIGVVITERVAFEERIPGLGVAPSRPRFRVAWS